MLEIKNKKIVIFLCLCIVGTVFYFKKIDVKEIKTIDVVVAKDDIAAGKIITDEMIDYEKRYINDVKQQSDLVLDKSEIIGMKSLVPLYKSEEISKNRLVVEGSMDDIKEGLVSIKLRKEDKALPLKINRFVDLWIEPNENGEVLGFTSQVVFQDKKILQVLNEDFEVISSETKNKVPEYICIEMSPEEVSLSTNISEANYYPFKIVLISDNYSNVTRRNK